MARLIQPLDETEIKKIGVANLRDAYRKLAEVMNRILNGQIYQCHCCNEFHSAESFYNDKRFATGLYPECKKALLLQATDYDKKTNEYKDNREKTIEVFKKLDLPFYDSLYKSALQTVQAEVGEKNRQTAYQHMLVMVKTLSQYKGKHFENSEFDEELEPTQVEINENSRVLKSAKKRFGTDYKSEDLIWLENEYQDWITRYECNTKAQEEIYKNLSTNRLERKQAVKDGKPTKEIDKTFQELLATNNIQPRQTGMDTMADAQTFGTLLQKWEETRPLPDIDPALEDVDKIGLYFDVFFRGHTLKMLGLKNTFTNIYEKIIKKYTVTKPEYSEEEDSEAIFEKVFGSINDE